MGERTEEGPRSELHDQGTVSCLSHFLSPFPFPFPYSHFIPLNSYPFSISAAPRQAART